MATASSSSVRSLQPAEVALICISLELQAKSSERAARAASNSVIADEHTKLASMARNLSMHVRNGSLAV